MKNKSNLETRLKKFVTLQEKMKTFVSEKKAEGIEIEGEVLEQLFGSS